MLICANTPACLSPSLRDSLPNTLPPPVPLVLLWTRLLARALFRPGVLHILGQLGRNPSSAWNGGRLAGSLPRDTANICAHQMVLALLVPGSRGGG